MNPRASSGHNYTQQAAGNSPNFLSARSGTRRRIKYCFLRIAYCSLPVLFCLLPAANSFSQVWDSLESGLQGGANVQTIYPAFGKLFVGGNFGTAANAGVRRWNGVKWDTLGPGIQNGNANSFYLYNNELYLGGGFSGWGVPGVPNTDYLAKWNDTAWSAVSVQNPNNDVKAIAYRNELYAGGMFTQIGSATYREIAKFNGVAWSGVAGGVYGGFSTINTFCEYNGKLIVGGGFLMAGGPGGIPCWHIASWDGIKWDTLAGGTDGRVFSLAVDTANNFLYAGGNLYGVFNRGEYTSTNFVARWDGYQWSPVGNNKGNNYVAVPGGARTLEMYHGELVAGGVANAGLTNDTTLSRWDGANWYRMAGSNNTIHALKVWRDTMYVGGSFDTIGGIPAKKIAQYYAPRDTTCNFLQSIMYAYPPGSPKFYADTFYYNTDSVAIEFYNNIASASSWQWDFGDSTTGSGKTPVHYYTAGTYTVSVIVTYPYGPKGPCIDTVYKTITIINTTGVKEFKVESLKFKVYPNPTTGEITIITDEKGVFTASISNTQGKEVVRKNFEREIKLTLPNAVKGVYTVRVCARSPKGRGGEGLCHTEKVIIH